MTEVEQMRGTETKQGQTAPERPEFSAESCSMHEAVQCAASYLQKCGIEDAHTDAWLLFEFVTGITRAMFLAERRRPVDGEDLDRYAGLLQKRGRHIPLQHLTGEQEFMGLSFCVNEHVLIPRQDTETLVEEALKRLRPGMHVLDLCTGSGCIAISLAKLGSAVGNGCHGIELTVDASDLSEDALAVARENGARLDAAVNWIHSDLFSQIGGTYDMIVSNPPYIRTDVIAELSEEVRLHEPFQALDGKEDGLYFYRRIIDEGRAHLNEGGWMLFEIGYDQGPEVRELMQKAGFSGTEVICDLAGNDRVVIGQLGKKCAAER